MRAFVSGPDLQRVFQTISRNTGRNQAVQFVARDGWLFAYALDQNMLTEASCPADVVVPGTQAFQFDPVLFDPREPESTRTQVGAADGRMWFQGSEYPAVQAHLASFPIVNEFPEHERVHPEGDPVLTLRFGFTHSNTLASVMNKLAQLGGGAKVHSYAGGDMHLRHWGGMEISRSVIRYVVSVPYSTAKGDASLLWSFSPERLFRALDPIVSRPDFTGTLLHLYGPMDPAWVTGEFENPAGGRPAVTVRTLMALWRPGP